MNIFMGFFKGIVISIVALIATAAIEPEFAHAEYGATIEYTNCDPGADPAFDYLKTYTETRDGVAYSPTKSCVGQNISVGGTHPFRVRVKFAPTAAYIASYIAANLAAIIIVRAVTYWGAYNVAYYACNVACRCGPGCVPSARSAGKTAIFLETVAALAALTENAVTADAGDTYIKVGDTVPLLKGDIGAMATAEVRIEGSKACVHMQARPVPFLNFLAKRSDNFNTAYNITSKTEELPYNCVYMPSFSQIALPAVPKFISKSCIEYDSSASHFRWPDGRSRSFFGVVAQCVQQSMTNLFFNKHNGETQTTFQKFQERMQNIIKVLMVLYIVIIGYKNVIEADRIDQEEFISIAWKVALIWYLALGDVFVNHFKSANKGLQEFSAIIIDAASKGNSIVNGHTITRADAKNQLDAAIANYNAAQDAYVAAAKKAFINPTSTADKDAFTHATEDRDNAFAQYREINVNYLSYGYNYCNFDDFVDAGLYNHNYTAEDGTSVTEDMSYMQLWDSIDCRMAKYLGIGENVDSPSVPQVFLFAIASLTSVITEGNIFGFIIFFLVLVFTLYVVFLMIRIVHIYIVSFVFLMFLAYIFPVVLPMILFEYTKGAFSAWMKNFVGYAFQPLVLFCFLTFCFSIFDNIIYGENYNFNQTTVAGHAVHRTLNDNTIKRTQDNFGKWVCEDENVLGCIYESIRIEKSPIEILGVKLLDVYSIRFSDFTSEHIFPENITDPPSATKSVKLGLNKYKIITVNLLKLVLITYILSSLMSLVGQVAATTSNVLGGSVNYSALPNLGPSQISKALAAPTAKLGGAGVSGAKSLYNGAKGVVRRQGIRNDKNNDTKNAEK